MPNETTTLAADVEALRADFKQLAQVAERLDARLGPLLDRFNDEDGAALDDERPGAIELVLSIGHMVDRLVDAAPTDDVQAELDELAGLARAFEGLPAWGGVMRFPAMTPAPS